MTGHVQLQGLKLQFFCFQVVSGTWSAANNIHGKSRFREQTCISVVGVLVSVPMDYGISIQERRDHICTWTCS
jgi:hypothetical protein